MVNTEDISFFDEPLKIFSQIIEDINNAKHFVFIEVYIWISDDIGNRFRDIVTKKVKQGIKIWLLLDSWGTRLPNSYFNEFIKHGGKVTFFKKINLINLNQFTETHRRNHRKLIIIDDKISYIGSFNINSYSLNWKESAIRINNSTISSTLRKVFWENLRISSKYLFHNKKITFSKPLVVNNNYEIIRDVPSSLIQNIKKRLIAIIENAKNYIIIETPYFIPGTQMIKALIDAAKRNVSVSIILPKHSDVTLIDLLRNKYLGNLYNAGIKIYFFQPQNLHAKLLIADDDKFYIGSSNFDYRSFRFQFEIGLFGNNPNLVETIKKHSFSLIDESEIFNYNNWKKRPLFQKLLEKIITPFRHLF